MLRARHCYLVFADASPQWTPHNSPVRCVYFVTLRGKESMFQRPKYLQSSCFYRSQKWRQDFKWNLKLIVFLLWKVGSFIMVFPAQFWEHRRLSIKLCLLDDRIQKCLMKVKIHHLVFHVPLYNATQEIKLHQNDWQYSPQPAKPQTTNRVKEKREMEAVSHFLHKMPILYRKAGCSDNSMLLHYTDEMQKIRRRHKGR